MAMDQNVSIAGNDKPEPRLDQLPEEILQSIFQYLDAITLTSISTVSKQFLSVANGHLIWKQLCLRDFTYWSSQHEIETRKSASNFHGWKDLYATRHAAHVAAAKGLRTIIDDHVGRIGRVQEISEHGYGIKDTLLQLYQESPLTDCSLAQRYWTHTLLSCVNRSKALETLTRIRYRSDIENPTELAIAALDMFTIGSGSVGDIDDTFGRLDSYVDAVRATYPDLDSQTPRTRAVTIASFLRSKGWIGITEGSDYYSIEHQFLGYAVRSQHRNSIPLITCVIYCYVCRAFNLHAQPCSYPNHVHAVIQPSDPTIDLDGNPLDTSLPASGVSTPSLDPPHNDEPAGPPSELTHLYMDPFNNHDPVSLSTLSTQLTFIDPTASTAQRTSYLTPATPRSLLLRTAKNILRSINTSVNTSTTITMNDAAYAALFVLCLFPSTPAFLTSNVSELRHHFAGNFIEDLANYTTYVAPLAYNLGNFGGNHDPLIKYIREEDARVKKPKLRATEPGGENVMFKVGTLFRHRRQGYVAAVYGWDPKCDQGERWILGNGVDRLGGGRGQPFYNAYVDDRSSRYVAQENIVPLKGEEFAEGEVESMFSVEIGKWFRRYDRETGMFVSNVRDEYPED